MVLQPLHQADEVETQVVAGRGDGALLDRFEADRARLRFGIVAGSALAFAGGAFGLDVVFRRWVGVVQPMLVLVVHSLRGMSGVVGFVGWEKREDDE